jgi:ribosome-associated translation inhibitor RaiA
MRVLVSSVGGHLDAQLRTYAEYRIFSTLSTHDNVAGARVELRTEQDTVQCDVRVTLAPRGSVQARASAPHAAAAIDRAAEQLTALIDGQSPAISS